MSKHWTGNSELRAFGGVLIVDKRLWLSFEFSPNCMVFIPNKTTTRTTQTSGSGRISPHRWSESIYKLHLSLSLYIYMSGLIYYEPTKRSMIQNVQWAAGPYLIHAEAYHFWAWPRSLAKDPVLTLDGSPGRYGAHMFHGQWIVAGHGVLLGMDYVEGLPWIT